MNILICGHRAFAAKGLVDILRANGHNVLCFSRGGLNMDDNIITGSVDEVDKNPFLRDKVIDVIINFIVLKDGTKESNLSYIKALCHLSENHKVSKFIQISSISSYPNKTEYIDENTEIDIDGRNKGDYGAMKVDVDRYLIGMKNNCNIPVIFVRPGFIMAKDHPNPLGGIVKKVGCKIGILWGNKRSTLPVIRREVLHSKLVKIVEDERPLDVYLLLEKEISTKNEYAKAVAPDMVILGLPKWLVLSLASVLTQIGILNKKNVQKISGLFKRQTFNTTLTDNKLK